VLKTDYIRHVIDVTTSNAHGAFAPTNTCRPGTPARHLPPGSFHEPLRNGE
jgi:hypothetical protein